MKNSNEKGMIITILSFLYLLAVLTVISAIIAVVLAAILIILAAAMAITVAILIPAGVI